MEFIQKEILGFRMDQIIQMRIGAQQDQLRIAELKALLEKKPDDKKELESATDPFDPDGYDVPGSSSVTNQQQQDKDSQNSNRQGLAKIKLPSGETVGVKKPNIKAGDAPIKSNPTPSIADLKKKEARRKGLNGNRALNMPDFLAMLDPNNRYAKDPYDMNFIKNPLKEEFMNLGGNQRKIPFKGIDPGTRSALRQFCEALKSRTREVVDLDILSEDGIDGVYEQEQEDQLLLLEREFSEDDRNNKKW